jgi:anti-sigma B factor antagonist
MEIVEKQLGDVALLEMTGEIDGSNAAEAQSRVMAHITPGASLLLDMSGVSYMSSAGLRMLLSTYRSVTSNNGHIVLVGLSEEIQDTMSATGFLSYFVCQPTVDEALTVLSV